MSTVVVVVLVITCCQSLNVMVNGQSTGDSTISGTVRCGSGCAAVGLASGDPINAAGSVVAVMTMRLDPYTGYPRPDLPISRSVGASFDTSAHGHYALQGLLPGIYDLYASANGYKMVMIASGVTVHGGQSLSYDASVTPCPSTGSCT